MFLCVFVASAQKLSILLTAVWRALICPEQLTAMIGRHPSQPHPLLGDAALQFTTGSPHPSSVSANLLDLCLHLEQAPWIWAGQFIPMMLSSPHLSHFMLTS